MQRPDLSGRKQVRAFERFFLRLQGWDDAELDKGRQCEKDPLHGDSQPERRWMGFHEGFTFPTVKIR
jgi:hypothetical protein